jgi:hypothetical protein
VTRFDKAQLTAFLRAIDRNLTQKVKVVMVGGAAAAVAYDANVKTADVDIFNVIGGFPEALGAAATAARQETGLGISVGAAAVVDLPYNYEARLKPIRGLQLKKLKIVGARVHPVAGDRRSEAFDQSRVIDEPSVDHGFDIAHIGRPTRPSNGDDRMLAPSPSPSPSPFPPGPAPPKPASRRRRRRLCSRRSLRLARLTADAR